MIKYPFPRQEYRRDVRNLTFSFCIITTILAVCFLLYFEQASYQELVQQLRLSFSGIDELDGETGPNLVLIVARFSALLSLVVYFLFSFLFSFLFVRASSRRLLDGSYRQNAWLNVDDKNLIMVQANQLVYFTFSSTEINRMQRGYRGGASIDDLTAMARQGTLRQIPLDEIDELVSDHDSKRLRIKYKGGNYSLVFLNQAVKAHALELLQLLLPESLTYHRNERNRFKAALPCLVSFILLLLIASYIDIEAIRYMVSFSALFIALPKMFSCLIEPTITEIWSLPRIIQIQADA